MGSLEKTLDATNDQTRGPSVDNRSFKRNQRNNLSYEYSGLRKMCPQGQLTTIYPHTIVKLEPMQPNPCKTWCVLFSIPTTLTDTHLCTSHLQPRGVKISNFTTTCFSVDRFLRREIRILGQHSTCADHLRWFSNDGTPLTTVI